MNQKDYGPLLLEIKERVCWLTLNRPEVLNAIDRDMAAALNDATDIARHDPDVRAVVIEGAGDHFMAGGDLKFFKERIDAEPDKAVIKEEFENFVRDVHPTMVNLREMPQPVIAVVRGSAAGFGVSLMIASDLAIAADDAVFTLAYSHVAVSADGSSTYNLPRLVGVKKAYELMILSEQFGAEEAKRLGLITRIVPSGEVAERAAKLAGQLAAGPTHAYGETKRLFNRSLSSSLDDQLTAEEQAFGGCAATEDFEEAITAFLEKRKPEFKGK